MNDNHWCGGPYSYWERMKKDTHGDKGIVVSQKGTEEEKFVLGRRCSLSRRF